jgi:hypothetical protein
MKRSPAEVRSAAVVAALLLGACSPSAPSPTRAPAPAAAPGSDADAFRDVTAASGVDFAHVLVDGALDSLPESVGAGATCFDYDGDGRMDLFFVAQGWCDDVHTGEPKRGITRHRLYRNLGGGRFADVTDRAGVGREEFAFCATAGDFDDDGRADLLVVGQGVRRLFKNRGDGTFEDVAESAGLADASCAVAAAFLDADGDGRLDVYVGNYVSFDKKYRLHFKPVVFPGPLAFPASHDQLYLNNGDGTFRDASQAAGLRAFEPGRAMGVTVLDYDGDGRPDLYVANDATASFLLHNAGGGKFDEVGVRAGVAYGANGEATAAMVGLVGDVNDDGRPDIRVTASNYGSMFMNLGDGLFADRVFNCGIAGAAGQWPQWGGGFFDYDNDGRLDLHLATGDLYRNTGRPDLLFRGKGDGTFADVSRASGAWFREERCARGSCVVDFDDDARMDVVVSHVGGTAALLRNQTRTNHAVLVSLRAKPRTASGQGARVTVVAGGTSRTQFLWPRAGYLGSGDPRLHFGLGSTDRVTRLEVAWTDGTKQSFENLPADRVYTVTEGGSIQ